MRLLPDHPLLTEPGMTTHLPWDHRRPIPTELVTTLLLLPGLHRLTELATTTPPLLVLLSRVMTTPPFPLPALLPFPQHLNPRRPSTTGSQSSRTPLSFHPLLLSSRRMTPPTQPTPPRPKPKQAKHGAVSTPFPRPLTSTTTPWRLKTTTTPV